MLFGVDTSEDCFKLKLRLIPNFEFGELLFWENEILDDNDFLEDLASRPCLVLIVEDVILLLEELWMSSW